MPPLRHTHIARFAARSQSCAAGDFGQCRLLPGLLLSAAILIRLPIALILQTVDSRQQSASSFCANDVGKIGGKPLASRADQSKHPGEPLRLKEIQSEWNTQNWRTEARTSRSHTPQLRPGRKLLGKRLSQHGCSGRRWAARGNQMNWFAAIAGAVIWLRVSLSGGIADAASVLVNAMDQWHGRAKRRSRSSLTTT